MRALKTALHVLSLAILANCAWAEPSVGFTTYLGPFTGEDAKLHPDNVAPRKIAYYGTDLGWSYEHHGRIHFLFGDTWATEAYAPIEASTGSRFDDGFGTIEIAAWPDPSLISASKIPLIKLGQNPGTGETSAMDPGHAMDLGKTPMGGFSNGTREFGIFNLGKSQGCRTDADCSHGLSCDASLGYIGVRYSVDENLTLPCRDGAPGCNPDTMTDAAGTAVPESGFCVDPTSSIGADPVSNVLNNAGYKVRIGVRALDDPRKYRNVHDWMTNKFLNVAVRTVQDFVAPKAGALHDQVYDPATAAGENRRVFLWGRPGFVGVNAKNRRLALYFAYVDMPVWDDLRWEPNYYTGTSDGIPKFSREQQDAAPLDLDTTRDGMQPEDRYDVVDQMSIVWVKPLRKWVMFYGGGMGKVPRGALATCGVLELFTGAECENVVVGNGAFRMRTADQPWGPWSPPQDLIVAGDPAVPDLQYGIGGALRHPECTDPGCAPHTETPFYDSEKEYGFFYAPNIIEQWIHPAGSGVDIIWNASTWDPYRVILLRTHIEP